MSSTRPAFSWQALLSALSLPVAAWIAHAWVELGINDDRSYIRSAQVFAHTGHIVYTGWSAPILGWQLVWGALFVRLFGDSFTALRLSTLLIAMATVYLFHRILVRCGVSERMSTLGALTLAMSPIFFPIAIGFMSDVSGLFVILLCLYGCIRAVSASTGRATIAWLSFAALSNAVGGTVRQTAWLGLLVIVPSTFWLVRRRRAVLLTSLVT